MRATVDAEVVHNPVARNYDVVDLDQGALLASDVCLLLVEVGCHGFGLVFVGEPAQSATISSVKDWVTPQPLNPSSRTSGVEGGAEPSVT